MSALGRGITLRHLVFTGATVEPASLTFERGLNVVYGASNTGKSSAAKALAFMLGGKRWIRASAENEGYQEGWLGLTLPDGRDVTLYRSVEGGAFRLYEGLVTSKPDAKGETLKGKHDHAGNNNVSMFLLGAIGLGVKWVVRNGNGEKHTLSFRQLAPYVIVEEGAIIEERSPILSGQHIERTVERNVFKVLMTGRDDEKVVTVPDDKEVRTLDRGRVQTFEELIEQADTELGDAGIDRAAIERQADAISAALALRTESLRSRQVELDAAVTLRREKLDAVGNSNATLQELRVTVRRYDELDAVYRSDLERLKSLEENSFLLKTIRGRECPTCGAPAHDQTHGPGVAEIERFHRAATAEMGKITRERTELRVVRAGLDAEAAGRAAIVKMLLLDIKELDETIARLRIEEASARQGHDEFLSGSERIRDLRDLLTRRDHYLARKAQLEARSANRPEKVELAIGIDGPSAFAFAKVVEAVLAEWGFPDTPQVSWDDAQQDIRLDGKERAANGKGVRAVLHSAFKVAVMIYCHDRKLPHPGFIVLDTPLLTYREPIDEPKHGELEEDEAALKSTNLNERFYRHLAGIASIGQVIVLENTDPPPGLSDIASVTTFTKRNGPDQRYGFFPVAKGPQLSGGPTPAIQ